MERKICLDFHTPEYPKGFLEGFDPRELVNTLVKTNVNSVFVFAKDHYGNSYYNTDVGHRHKGLRIDYLGEIIKYAHLKGLKIYVYYSVGWDNHAALKNNDWRRVNFRSEPILSSNDRWSWICINSPYKDKLILPQIREIVSQYEIDGFFFDMVYPGKDFCFCKYCKEKFFGLYHKRLNKNALSKYYPLVEKFHNECFINFASELRHKVKDINPSIPIAMNGVGSIGFHKVTRYVDLLTAESHPTLGYGNHSLMSRYARTIGKPFDIITARFISGWGEWTLKPVETLKYEFAQILANGGQICCGDQAYATGMVEPAVYKLLSEAFKFAAEREPFCIQAKSIPHIAVLSKVDFNWEGINSIRGVHKMLVEEHQQFDILDIDQIDKMNLYKIVILPDEIYLEEKESKRIRQFVSHGGCLVASHRAALSSSESANFCLSDVLGIKFSGFSSYPVGYFLLQKKLQRWLTLKMPVLVHGEILKVNLTHARALTSLFYPMGKGSLKNFYSHGNPPCGQNSGFAAVTINNYGKGKAIYIAAPIFRMYWIHNHQWLRQILSVCMEELAIEAPFYVEAPASVELNLMKRNNELFLHFVNFHSGWGADKTSYPVIEDIVPVSNVHVKIKADRIKKVTLEPERGKIKYRFSNGFINIEISQINIYSILRIEF